MGRGESPGTNRFPCGRLFFLGKPGVFRRRIIRGAWSACAARFSVVNYYYEPNPRLWFIIIMRAYPVCWQKLMDVICKLIVVESAVPSGFARCHAQRHALRTAHTTTALFVASLIIDFVNKPDRHRTMACAKSVLVLKRIIFPGLYWKPRFPSESKSPWLF